MRSRWSVLLNFIERQQLSVNHRDIQWRNVGLSNESKFNLCNADGRDHIVRRHHERYADNCVRTHNLLSEWGVMVWGQQTVFFFNSELVIMNDYISWLTCIPLHFGT